MTERRTRSSCHCSDHLHLRLPKQVLPWLMLNRAELCCADNMEWKAMITAVFPWLEDLDDVSKEEENRKNSITNHLLFVFCKPKSMWGLNIKVERVNFGVIRVFVVIAIAWFDLWLVYGQREPCPCPDRIPQLLDNSQHPCFFFYSPFQNCKSQWCSFFQIFLPGFIAF